MLARLLDGGGQTQQFLLRKTVGCRRFGQPGAAFGQRAGLIDDERVDPLHDFQGFRVFHQDSLLSPPADSDHDRHRRGQAQAQGQATISTATALTSA